MPVEMVDGAKIKNIKYYNRVAGMVLGKVLFGADIEKSRVESYYESYPGWSLLAQERIERPVLLSAPKD